MSEVATPERPVIIDAPEAYAQVSGELTVNRLDDAADFEKRLPRYGEDQKELIEREARLFGVDPSTDPQRFVEAHASFVTETEALLQECLPRVKREVVERVANYFGKDDEATTQGLKDLLTKRLEATQRVELFDSLANNRDISGFFSSETRQPWLTTSRLAEIAEQSEDSETFQKAVEETVLAHEVMHGIFTAGTQEAWIRGSVPVRNGLKVRHHSDPANFMKDTVTAHGVWPNEGALEDFRQEIFDTEEVSYEPEVIVIRTLDELSPGLRDELRLGAVDAKGPGATFGKLELLLGPTGVEDVAEALGKVSSYTEDFPRFKAEVIGLLPKDIQERASVIFDQKEAEVLGRRDYYQKARAA